MFTMAVNPTSLLRHIKMMLGAPYKVLPISDEDILNIVFEETLYTYSSYYPYFTDIVINGDKDRVPGDENMGIYYLDNNVQFGDDLEIMGVARVLRKDGYYTTSLYPVYRESDFIDIQLATDLSSATQVPDTFKFLEPNKIEIFPKSRTNYSFQVRVKCVHPRHLGTIPLSMREYFFKLATLDVKIALFYMLKNYDQLNTPYGNIDLKIEDYEQAVQEREELLQLFKANYWKESNRKKLWIY